MPNLNEASKAAIYRANVAKLDGIGTNAAEFIKINTQNVIEKALGDFVARVHKNINNTPQMVTTGAINNMTIQAEDGAVNIVGAKHLIYQDRGVNGSEIKKYNTPHSYTDKMPPPDVFAQWIREKNIRLKDNKKYRGKESPFKDLTSDKAIESAAFGMAMKVFKEGFKPRKVFGVEIPKLLQDLSKEVANIGVQSIIQSFDGVKPSAQRVIPK